MEKIWFNIEQDEDGYPPVQIESVWATPVGGNLFRLENVPFFAKGVSFKDEVSTSEGPDGKRWYEDVVEPSGHSNCVSSYLGMATIPNLLRSGSNS